MVRLAVIETGGGLIQKQQSESARDGARQFDDAALPRGEVADESIGQVRKAAHVDRLGRGLPDLGPLRGAPDEMREGIHAREASFPTHGYVLI